ncbi:UNVERIFIED_CONTAM: hypothetical protein Sradi_4051400 [Sesamum radiatum]|uniref:Uncharacterized protein n=1 Tax=Sesamum radiatum TaxID=300843 RepID=A0AAW2PIJ8_SESRA
MKNPNQTTDKQKGATPPIGTQALQVISGAPPLPGVTGSPPAAFPPASLPPRVTDPAADPPVGARLQTHPRRSCHQLY